MVTVTLRHVHNGRSMHTIKALTRHYTGRCIFFSVILTDAHARAPLSPRTAIRESISITQGSWTWIKALTCGYAIHRPLWIHCGRPLWTLRASRYVIEAGKTNVAPDRHHSAFVPAYYASAVLDA